MHKHGANQAQETDSWSNPNSDKGREETTYHHWESNLDGVPQGNQGGSKKHGK